MTCLLCLAPTAASFCFQSCLSINLAYISRSVQPGDRRDAATIRNAENSQEAFGNGPHPLERERTQRLKSNHSVISKHMHRIALDEMNYTNVIHEYKAHTKQILHYVELTVNLKLIF